jgi:hypothetical protein
VLYLPEGVAHWARTHGNETSVHLTCGYTPARWHHLFAGVAETSLQDELALLDRFPPEIAQNPDAFADEIQRRQALLGQDLGRAAELVLQRFADRTEHNARAQVSPSDTVDWTDPTLRLQVSKGVSQRVFGGELRLKNVPLGRSVTLFLKHRPMWIWMRQNPTFQPHELPGVLPPELKQLFCAYLLSNGLLRTVPTAAPDGESTA